MTLDDVIVLAGLLSEAALLLFLLKKRAFRVLPVFISYLCFSLGINSAGLLVAHQFPNRYLSFWIVNAVTDAGFYCCVLIEVGKNVLRYNRASLSRRPLVILLFVLAGILVSSLAQGTVFAHSPLIWWLALYSLQATAILQVTAILTLAWWSGLLDLVWPERELQIATGLGFCALVELGTTVLHIHMIGLQYHWLDLLAPLSYLGVLIFWFFYFVFETGSIEQIEPRMGVGLGKLGANPPPPDNTESRISLFIRHLA